jgi:hypothetical protein
MYDQASLSQQAFMLAHAVEQKENQLLELIAVDCSLLSEDISRKSNELRKQIEDLKQEFAQIIHQCIPK